jgi:hypothetical protein
VVEVSSNLPPTGTFTGFGEVNAESFTMPSRAPTPTHDPTGRLLTVTKDGTLVEEYRYNANGARDYEMNTLRGIAGRTLSYDDEDHRQIKRVETEGPNRKGSVPGLQYVIH